MQTPQAHHGIDLLQTLCEQMERNWNAHRNATIVDQLAAEHPEFAHGLYEFFTFLVQGELDLGRPDPTFAKIDGRALNWLASGGYERVAEAARQHAAVAAGTPTPGPNDRQSSPLTARTGDEGHAPASPTPSPAAGEPVAGVITHGRGIAPRGAVRTASPARKRLKGHTFLGLLIETTKETPDVIAAELGVNANFLVGVDELRDELPPRARDELARRAERRFTISRAIGLEHLSGRDAPPLAAARTSAYEERLTYREVVRLSRMAPTDEAFWLSLADAIS